MKTWSAGMVLAVGGVILLFPLDALGFKCHVSAFVASAVCFLGFVIQVYATLRMRASFKRERELAKQKQVALLERMKKLPPAEA
ncbi:MAG: hypothetical protein NTY04_03205, partial [Candidatus Staskawiczbacteria bacterium]|nr:hypothetical protein [Candidatus Staskawiczbacteria bacterium]